MLKTPTVLSCFAKRSLDTSNLIIMMDHSCKVSRNYMKTDYKDWLVGI